MLREKMLSKVSDTIKEKGNYQKLQKPRKMGKGTGK